MVLRTASIFLHSIDCLVFITETECVYCAVRNIPLNIFLDNISLKIFKALVSITFRACCV